MKNNNEVRINKNYGTVNEGVNVNIYNYYENEWNNNDEKAHYKLPFRYKLFTGRSKELNRIHDILSNYSIAILSGIGGIGKSQIIKEFALTNVIQYELIVWINAGNEEELQSEFRQIATYYSLSPNINDIEISIIIEKVKSFISNKNSSLLIFDGLDDVEPSIIKKYIPTVNSKILVSTQNATYDDDEFEIIQIEDFNQEDAEKLILENTSKRHERATDNFDAKKLAKLLCCYPLAIEHARAYINKNRISIEEYYDLYERENISIFSNSLSDYEQTALTTFKISFDKAVGSAKNAYALLGYSSLMNLNEIPYEIILKDTFEDKTLLREAVDALLNYSLININGKYLSLHGIVQHNMQSRLRQDSNFEIYAKDLCKSFEKQLPTNVLGEKDRDLAKELLPHVSYLMRLTISLSELEDKTLDLSLHLGKLLYEFGEFQEAIEFMKIVLQISVSSGRYKHRIDTLNSLGISYHYTGNPEESFRCSFKAKELLEDRTNQSDELWWHALNASIHGNLGIMYKVRTDHDKSLECYQIALKSAEILDNSDLIINQLINIGVNYKNQGENDKALEVYDRAIQVESSNENIKRKVYANKAVILRLIGDYTNAKTTFMKDAEISRKIGDRRSECISLFNIGMCLYGMEEGEEALKTLEEAYRLSDKINLLTSKADILVWIGMTHHRFSHNLEFANEYYQKAYEIASKTQNHSVLSFLQNLKRW